MWLVWSHLFGPLRVRILGGSDWWLWRIRVRRRPSRLFSITAVSMTRRDLDPLADRGLCELGRFDQEEDVVVLERQGL